MLHVDRVPEVKDIEKEAQASEAPLELFLSSAQHTIFKS